VKGAFLAEASMVGQKPGKYQTRSLIKTTGWWEKETHGAVKEGKETHQTQGE